MKKNFLFLLTILMVSAYGQDNNAYLLALTEGEPSAMVHGCVNALTGEMLIYENDRLAEGAEPILLPFILTTRYGVRVDPLAYLVLYYDNDSCFYIFEKSGACLSYEKPVETKLGTSSYCTLKLDEKEYQAGITNCARKEISGRANPRNNVVTFQRFQGGLPWQVNIKGADGTLLHYEKCAVKYGTKEMLESKSICFRLTYEILPNGNKKSYIYGESSHKILEINTTNARGNIKYASVHFSYLSTEHKEMYAGNMKQLSQKHSDKTRMANQISDASNITVVTTSDGNQVTYICNSCAHEEYIAPEQYALLHLNSRRGVTRQYFYTSHDDRGKRLLKKIDYGDGRFLNITHYTKENSGCDGYDDLKVRELTAPVGENGEERVIYTFKYHPGELNKRGGMTEVFDVYGNKTEYYYSAQLRLEEIKHFNGSNVMSSEKFMWGKDKEASYIVAKTILDSQGKAIFSKCFIYDSYGNVISEKLYGNLSGKCFIPIQFDGNGLPINNGAECCEIIREYSQDGRNLLLKEIKPNGQTTLFTYLDHPDLLLSKIILDHDVVKIRYFYEYNTDNILVKEIEDDGCHLDKNDLSGITQRKTKIIYPVGNDGTLNMKPDQVCEVVSGLGLPQVIEECYLDIATNTDNLLQKMVLTYEARGTKVAQKDIYDSNNQFCYSCYFQYDSKDRLTQERNTLGQAICYDYDQQNNLIGERHLINPVDIVKTKGKHCNDNHTNIKITKKASWHKHPIEGVDLQGRTIIYGKQKGTLMAYNNSLTINKSYDLCNRLTAIEEVGNDGLRRTGSTRYDLRSNKIATVDEHGNETRYCYDNFGHITKTYFSSTINANGESVAPTMEAHYNDMGMETSYTDPEGRTTHTEYNAYGKPTKITHSDGSIDENVYNIDGSLAYHIDPIGTKTVYKYDFLNRDISTKVISSDNVILRETSKIFSSFNLTSTTDGNGITTYYYYDGAGRKTSEKTNDDTISFVYDALGREKKLIAGDRVTITERDYLNRIVEERSEGTDGSVKHLVKYTYDADGNKSGIIKYINGNTATQHGEYDAFHRITKKIDALGHIITISYDDNFHNRLNQRVLRITKVMPSGLRKVTTYDVFGKKVLKEKFNSAGKLLSKEERFYNLSQKLARKLSTVIDKSSSKLLETCWEYDCMDRLITLKEASNSTYTKITTYTYDLKGNLIKIRKPDGKILENSYDALNSLISIRASDNSCYYTYTHDGNGNIIRAKDVINDKECIRQLDVRGRVIYEKLFNDLTITRSYDVYGRKRAFNFFAGSIVYDYDACNLTSITRKDVNGTPVYQHQFINYDLSGNCLKERLANGNYLDRSVDLLNRPYLINTAYLTESIESFDVDSHVKAVKRDGSMTTYSYDDLGQLTEESGVFKFRCEYDSLYNRISKNGTSYQLNLLNELTYAEGCSYSYDANGNPANKTSSDTSELYTYDILGRLIEIIKPTSYRLIYTYDCFNRRMSKEYFHWEASGWSSDYKRIFLYDGEEEVGCINADGTLHDLKVGHAAIEIDNNTYISVYDLFGNVAILLSSTNLYERYLYNAFGEELIYDSANTRLSSSINCWRFNGKRADENGFICYGYRYYYPITGRWLTPDPSGFTNGLNLYLYLYNDPFNFSDDFGLEAYDKFNVTLPKTLFNTNLNDFSVGDFILPPSKRTPVGVISLLNPKNLTYQCGKGVMYSVATNFLIPQKGAELIDLGRPEISSTGTIYYTNGVNTSRERFMETLDMLSRASGGFNIHGVYDETLGLAKDIAVAKTQSDLFAKTNASEVLKQTIIHDLDMNPYKTACVACFSNGATTVRNMLMDMPDVYRKRIDVLVLGGAVFIDQELCHKVNHYISTHDAVYFNDLKNLPRAYLQGTVNFVPAHPDAPKFDHDVLSPTYAEPIGYTIDTYKLQDKINQYKIKGMIK
jgi:RHS repeat-associated protein